MHHGLLGFQVQSTVFISMKGFNKEQTNMCVCVCNYAIHANI